MRLLAGCATLLIIPTTDNNRQSHSHCELLSPFHSIFFCWTKTILALCLINVLCRCHFLLSLQKTFICRRWRRTAPTSTTSHRTWPPRASRWMMTPPPGYTWPAPASLSSSSGGWWPLLFITSALLIPEFYCSFIAVFCAFWTGLTGCWKRSAGAITGTAILMLCACLLAAGGMGLWHTVEFFEKEKVVGEEFYQQWTSVGFW